MSEHPWSKISKEESDKRKRMLHSAMLVSGVFLVILFAVQIRASVSASGGELVSKDAVEVGGRTLGSALKEASSSFKQMNDIKDSITESIEEEIVKEKATSVMFDKLAEDIDASQPPETADANPEDWAFDAGDPNGGTEETQ